MKKSRNTRQRAVILDILKATRSHPSAEAIYMEARRVLPNISLGTVYRNLNFLQEQEMVKEIRACDGSGSRFEAVIPPHAHFHCSHCHCVQDVPLPDSLHECGWQRSPFISEISMLELHLVGSCSSCAPSPVPAA